jgi:hypothetical protein
MSLCFMQSHKRNASKNTLAEKTSLVCAATGVIFIFVCVVVCGRLHGKFTTSDHELRHVCPSVLQHGAALLGIEGIFVKLGPLTKISHISCVDCDTGCST